MITAEQPAWTASERATQMRKWRIVMFALTWLTYATFYLSRKNYNVALPAFMADLEWSKTDVGIIGTTYLTVYAIGQFTNGSLCDRFGPRVMIAVGFGLTASLSVGLGFTSTIVVMATLYGLNGYAQSMGWPAVTKAMTNWVPITMRGRVMGWWGTCYPAGDAIATGFAAVLLGVFGWRYTFIIPAVAVVVLGTIIVLVMKNHPRDVGLAAPAPPRSASTTAPPWYESLTHLKNGRVITLGLSYFCLKFVRYAFLFWIGVYLVESMDFSAEEAGFLQVPFPLAGLAGSVAGGWVSDKLFDARRAPAAVFMLIGLAIAIFGLLFVPANPWLVGTVYGAVGFFLFGPDMLISGTAAMDFGSEEAAATVAGFVNGVGAIGAALQPTIIGWTSDTYGWSAVFYLLIAMVIVCTGITATLWNARGKAT